VTPAQLRSSPRWKRVRKIVLRTATHCAFCHRRLDFDAPPRSRWSPSVDHVTPLALGGDPFAVSNLRAAHYGCNTSSGAAIGNRSPKRAARRRAADWRRYVATGTQPRRADWW
jgi:5-methylcytosine-specific restriction endonuclease McrA